MSRSPTSTAALLALAGPFLFGSCAERPEPPAAPPAVAPAPEPEAPAVDEGVELGTGLGLEGEAAARIGAIGLRHYTALRTDARYAGMLDRGESTTRLAADGMARLSPEDLLAEIATRRAMADADPGFCAAQWTGVVTDPNVFGRALAASTDTVADDWFRLMTAAAIASLDHRPLPFEGEAGARAANEAGIAAVTERASEEERAALTRASVPSPTEADACAAIRVLFTHAPSLPPEIRDPFLAALLTRPPG